MAEPILLKSCRFVLDPFTPERANVDVLIEEGRISKIKERLSTNGLTIDCSNSIVVPGFMNGHTHSPMTLLRGTAEDMPLHDWLSKGVWPIEKKMKPRHIYVGAKLAVLEMLKSGFTAAADMYFHMLDVAKAYEELNFRGILCEGAIDNFDEDKAETELKLQKSMYKKLSSRRSGLIKPSLGPHATYTCSEGLLMGIAEFSEEKNALVHIHVAETEKEQEQCVKRYKVREVELLRKVGICNNRSVYAHGIWLNDKEMTIAGSAHTSVVQNAISNFKIACGGVADITTLEKKGARVCLGTDGPASNNSLDSFEMMKFAALAQKNMRKDAAIIKAKDIFRLATYEGYRVFLPELNSGRIKESATADLAVFGIDPVKHAPLVRSIKGHMLSHLVYSSAGIRAKDVIVNGKLSLHNYKLVPEKEEKIYREFGVAIKELYNA